MSKRSSFKSKQKTEATNFDWKIWSLPPTYTPPIDHPVVPHFFPQRIYCDFFFCDSCGYSFSTSDYCYRRGWLEFCLECYHEEEFLHL